MEKEASICIINLYYHWVWTFRLRYAFHCCFGCLIKQRISETKRYSPQEYKDLSFSTQHLICGKNSPVFTKSLRAINRLSLQKSALSGYCR